jgi:all-trans-retinol 13,14-reductase
LWWVFYAIAQGSYLASGGTYIRGGSIQLSRALVGVVETEGGEARPARTVTDIIVDDEGRAAGVVHTARDGSDRVVDHAPVIFGGAAPSVLAEALPPELSPAFVARYEGRHPSISLFSIALGLNRPTRQLGLTHYSTMLMPDWVDSLSDYARCAELLSDPPGDRMPPVGVVDYSAIDSGLNPNGPQLVSVVGVDRTENWDGLDDTAYRAKRDAWLDAIVAEIDRHMPGFADAIVQREMSTAATMHRYLNTPGGAVYGFAPEPPKGIPDAGSERAAATTVPGLWLTSSYGGFGGFGGVMMTGMLAAQAAIRTARDVVPRG